MLDMEYEQPDAVTRGSPARGTRWVQLPRAAHIHVERTLACPSGTRRKARVRLAAAAGLPGAGALELAAGLSWAVRGLGRRPTPPRIRSRHLTRYCHVDARVGGRCPTRRASSTAFGSTGGVTQTTSNPPLHSIQASHAILSCRRQGREASPPQLSLHRLHCQRPTRMTRNLRPT